MQKPDLRRALGLVAIAVAGLASAASSPDHGNDQTWHLQANAAPATLTLGSAAGASASSQLTVHLTGPASANGVSLYGEVVLNVLGCTTSSSAATLGTANLIVMLLPSNGAPGPAIQTVVGGCPGVSGTPIAADPFVSCGDGQDCVVRYTALIERSTVATSGETVSLTLSAQTDLDAYGAATKLPPSGAALTVELAP